LTMQAVTRATLTFQQSQARAVVPFNLSPDMRVTSAAVDGHPAEIFDGASLRAELIRGGDDRQFLLICDPPLDPASPHEIEIHHEGAVIRDAGNAVYFVGSRGTWYPRTGLSPSNYDLIFRYPAHLTLVATGNQIEDRIDGDYRITRAKTDTPVRFAGFNLGSFQAVTLEHNGYNLKLYANRNLEPALTPKAVTPDIPSAENPFRRRRSPPVPHPNADIAPGLPEPSDRIEELTTELQQTLDFMTEQFGPCPMRTIAVTPIPGAFGQGFPGLVYLSTLAYIDPGRLPPQVHEFANQTFFSDLLESHEIAHQWWGNLVLPATNHDDWLMESLANYSALLLLERRKGVKALDAVLDEYRRHLLTKTSAGVTVESAGPIVWGRRLESSLTPDAWRTVTYEKGTWIMHMLRRRLGDREFLALLRDVAEHHHSISTTQFRDLAQQYAPHKPPADVQSFFETWVYGTGIPEVKLSYSWRNGKLSGSLAEQDVDGSFTASVPVEVQTSRQTDVYWLPTGSDPAAFSIPMKSRPARVTLLVNNCLMTVAK
jgi:hypothetical protein